jgi:hypothetical protein
VLPPCAVIGIRQHPDARAHGAMDDRGIIVDIVVMPQVATMGDHVCCPRLWRQWRWYSACGQRRV